MPRFRIDVADEQAQMPIDANRLRRAVRHVLEAEGVVSAVVSVAVVDNATIRRLNAQYLSHDYATDALSFLLEEKDGRLEGQLVVSAEMAAARAPEFDWSAQDELLLYVVHGALHLAGYDDTTPAAAKRMRQRERHYLSELGVNVDRPAPRKAAGRAARRRATGRGTP